MDTLTEDVENESLANEYIFSRVSCSGTPDAKR